MAIVTYCSGGRRWTEWFTSRGPSPEPAPSLEAPTDRLQLGAHAKQLLDDPVLALVFDKVADDVTAQWRNTKADDAVGRERAYQLVWAIGHARARLNAMLGDAKVLQAEQERREKEDERKAARAA